MARLSDQGANIVIRVEGDLVEPGVVAKQEIDRRDSAPGPWLAYERHHTVVLQMPPGFARIRWHRVQHALPLNLGMIKHVRGEGLSQLVNDCRLDGGRRDGGTDVAEDHSVGACGCDRLGHCASPSERGREAWNPLWRTGLNSPDTR